MALDIMASKADPLAYSALKVDLTALGKTAEVGPTESLWGKADSERGWGE